ncbi:hypothetical protein GYMLUDRAFT_244682 [Collybiopsis luxurians FD-317 M1]|uniref:Uncharacterized protein n=1 Tax=Collybiopsis luxurians FD-317 M1 TaxID=944289 RepID=A0A0D0B9E7_9AGAR|nr:hypothetical protein GYMLUDRAFT_244682 [Collybiopsis luxurians FD-317 M1]
MAHPALRAESMNVVTRHPKVKVTLTLAEPYFIAGPSLSVQPSSTSKVTTYPPPMPSSRTLPSPPQMIHPFDQIAKQPKEDTVRSSSAYPPLRRLRHRSCSTMGWRKSGMKSRERGSIELQVKNRSAKKNTSPLNQTLHLAKLLMMISRRSRLAIG